MEVISSNDGLLTNIEVLEIIKENRAKQSNKTKISLQNRELIETKSIDYISSSKVGKLSSSVIAECIRNIKSLSLGLTDGEIIQIANLMPESDVELYLIIEDSATRLTDDQLALISTIINNTYTENNNNNNTME